MFNRSKEAKDTFTFTATVVIKAVDMVAALQYVQSHNEMIPDLLIHIKNPA